MNDSHYVVSLRIPRPSRRWLQLSLGTLLVVTLIAGLILGLLGRRLKDQRQPSIVELRTYYVADLVAVTEIARKQSSFAVKGFDPLIQSIESNVAPKTWSIMGGPGTIAPIPTNLSIVVSQSQEVHGRIAKYLGQQRGTAAIPASVDEAIALIASKPEEPQPAAVLEGFESIFNGQDLTGWEGSPKYWSVKDGCLTGNTDGSLDYNRFIIWRGGTLKNFELRVKVKVTAGGNSGLNYRSQQRPDLGDGVVTGYQCDVVPARADYNGMLYEERGRRILAHTGEKVIIDREGQPWVVDKLPIKEFKGDDWHEYRVLVRGNHHQHWIDGHPTVDVLDLDEKNRALQGILGVQVHVGPAMQIQYRDFLVKHLPNDLPIVQPDDAKIPASAVKVVPQGGKPKKKQPGAE